MDKRAVHIATEDRQLSAIVRDISRVMDFKFYIQGNDLIVLPDEGPSRDQIAAMVLPGILTAVCAQDRGINDGQCAKLAYDAADALVDERRRRQVAAQVPEAPRCAPDCKGIEIEPGHWSGCSCFSGKLANGEPEPTGFVCDCPQHPGHPFDGPSIKAIADAAGPGR